MNPVLLKPQSDIGAQVVVRGKVVGAAKARDYQALKPHLLPRVLESFAQAAARSRPRAGRGRRQRGGDQPARRRHRQYGLCPRGRCARRADRRHRPRRRHRAARRHAGRARRPTTRADRAASWSTSSAATPGCSTTGWRDRRRDRLAAFGLVPLRRAAPPAGRGRGGARPPRRADGGRTIVVPLLPRIANFDDFDPLRAEPACGCVSRARGAPLPAADLVILPGTKRPSPTSALRAEGWDIDILAHVRRGGRVLGICGGYQMLGRTSPIPTASRAAGDGAGLGLLDVETVLAGDKTLRRGRALVAGRAVRGLRDPCRPHGGPRAPACCASTTAQDGAVCAGRPVAAATSMACSPTTGSARPGSTGSAAGRRLATRRRRGDARRAGRASRAACRSTRCCGWPSKLGGAWVVGGRGVGG